MSKRKAADNELRYGLDIHSGKLRKVDEVARGKRCDCKCPGCKRLLVACKPEQKIRPYFRHYVENNAEGTSECANPEGARETIIHLLAKKVISGFTSIYLPDKYVGDSNYKGHLMKGLKVHSSSEEWVVTNGDEEDRSINKGFIPDVSFDTPRGKLLIEVLKSHKVDEEKRSKISDCGLYAVEIDVSDMQPDEIGITPLHQRLYNPAYSNWLSYPLSQQEKINLEARRASEAKRIDDELLKEEKEKKRLELQKQAEEQRRLELIELDRLNKERQKKREEAERRAIFKNEYEDLIGSYFRSAGSVYDLKPIGPSEQKNIKVALRVLCSALDSAFSDSVSMELSKRLSSEVKNQVKERKAFIKDKRLDSAVAIYLYENGDEEFDELLARNWLGETMSIPGRSDYWAPYLKEEIPEKIKKFLQNEADRLGLVKTRDSRWPYKNLDNIPF